MTASGSGGAKPPTFWDRFGTSRTLRYLAFAMLMMASLQMTVLPDMGQTELFSFVMFIDRAICGIWGWTVLGYWRDARRERREYQCGAQEE